MGNPEGQQQEFATLIDAFESLTRPADESQQFTYLLARFQAIADANHLARESKLSVDEARQLLDRFQRLWPKYLEENAEAPPTINVWEAAGPGHDEVRNCKLLRWLLDPNESHCQGTRLLHRLFESMGEPWIGEADMISVRTEVSEGDSRFDIIVESRSIFACIEVKIRAQESREQLGRYFELSMGKRIRGRRFIGRLLTVRGVSRAPVAEGFTRLLWSDVVCALRRFASGDSSDPLTARSTFVRELARQYADFITSYF